MGRNIKWDATADQILLAKILEVHGLSIDFNKVAEAWSSDLEFRPTARAIRERIFKIRGKAKAATTGLPGSQSPIATRNPATPRKPAGAQKAATTSGETTPIPPRKRKRAIKAEDSPTKESEDEGVETKGLFAAWIKDEPTSGQEDGADSCRED
ncbi:hypothetical protein PENARI_c041G02309 [Penicillium arizonense]|uniref:Uncharacterized protein n=1 Tax=Penicillium arizonense TaxID=1835702 RepID=A0A1F5L336_PENAI|nr:hypothetical protein PENARI_c041G02309 [Penicillium arizonense]OGE47592.1 hypothetical protein PENARI_c041G02309 [Penicillium arizonense]